eukprot:5879408-Pyramimonas_sp.AAC.1
MRPLTAVDILPVLRSSEAAAGVRFCSLRHFASRYACRRFMLVVSCRRFAIGCWVVFVVLAWCLVLSLMIAGGRASGRA